MPREPYQLVPTMVADWPKLGWAARVRSGSSLVEVFHGGCVEATENWCVEAVWAGDYSAGDFDRTDLITGSGIRLRGRSVVFVSSGDNLHRLQYHEDREALCVSNSLALLMAIAKLRLYQDYDYAAALKTIEKGLNDYQDQIPSSRNPVHIAYFRNLVVSGATSREEPKRSSAPEFRDFTTYRNFLSSTARAMGENASSPHRSHRITTVATLSKGYDSPAAAVLAREAGARDAFTVKEARRMAHELFDTDDAGDLIGTQLGFRMKSYSRFQENYPSEDASWASDGNIGDIYLSVFEYPQPLCLLFTGFLGDVIWGTESRQGLLRHRGTSGGRFSECRLELGVFNCAPALWGCRQQNQIQALSHRPEMEPWTLGTEYDRPIPRRIVEEAGGRRGSFASKKKVASFNRRYGQPLSESLREDFMTYMRQHGGKARSGLAERTSLLLKGLDSRIFRRLPKALRFSAREWIALPEPSSFFLWANDRRTRRYEAALDHLTQAPNRPAARVAAESLSRAV